MVQHSASEITTDQPMNPAPTVQMAPKSFANIQTPSPRSIGSEVIITSSIRIYVNFNSRSSRLLGIAQIVVAMMSIIFVAVGIVMLNKLPYDYRGFKRPNVFNFFWCPMFFLISGVIAVAASKRKTSSLIKALLGKSIVSMFVAITMCVTSILALIDISPRDKYSKVSMAMGVLLMLCGMAETATSIWLCKICGDQLCSTGVTRIIDTTTEVYDVITVNPEDSFSQSIHATEGYQAIDTGIATSTTRLIPGSNVLFRNYQTNAS